MKNKKEFKLQIEQIEQKIYIKNNINNISVDNVFNPSNLYFNGG